ncbi:MAG: RES family NAD+ phosphorylase [Thiobacillaceae bacterium]
MALSAPPRSFSKLPLVPVPLDPGALIRVSRFSSGEPYFGRSGANRFDDYRKAKSKRFGTCYFGLSLPVAFAEAVLHDEIPVKGKFKIAVEELENRNVVCFSGSPLQLGDMTGASLKRLGADGSLSTVTPYDLPQRWAVALHDHPAQVDGFLYVSRHMNTGTAVVLFDRARPKVRALRYDPLPDYPGALRAAMAFGLEFG